MALTATALPSIPKGTTQPILLVVTNNGVAPDITSAAFTFEAKYTVTDSAPLIVKTVGSGITITDGPNGKLTVNLVPADTAAIASGLPGNTDLPNVVTLVWACQMVLGGNTYDVAYGTLPVMVLAL